ncbi:MAG: hypothetical protein GF416_00035 [Candidatus Altiarchaeales archaeon]|nr:hypothetical protein [Candidatus Altiarchaeales archaeon]MBD3415509.1 hypothetical protein [Candidatus Altiarchaeales archaeon]
MDVMRSRAETLLAIAVLLFIIGFGNYAVSRDRHETVFNIYLNVSAETSAHAEGNNVFLRVEPGRYITGSVPVSNNSTDVRSIRLSLEGSLADTGWASLEEDGFILDGGEVREIGLRVDVPSSGSGSYEGRLLVEGVRV